jgi:Protein of unknown function (DUF3072)
MSVRNARHRRGGQNGRWKGWRGLGDDRRAPAFQRPPREPRMTPKQAVYLRDLCRKAGEPLNPALTKVQASRRIDELRRRLVHERAA